MTAFGTRKRQNCACVGGDRKEKSYKMKTNAIFSSFSVYQLIVGDKTEDYNIYIYIYIYIYIIHTDAHIYLYI